MSSIDTNKNGDINVKGQYKKSGSEGAIIAVVAGTFPAGGTGATAGAFDTAGHRDTFIASCSETATQLNALIVLLKAKGLIKTV